LKCLPCKTSNGWFAETDLKCTMCNSYCQTCSNNPNSCSSCYSPDTPSSGICNQAPEYYEVVTTSDGSSIKTLFGLNILASNCLGLNWLGGYGILGAGNYFEITISEKPPHYKIRIQFRFLKIDSWTGHDAQIYVDNNLQNINELKGLSSSAGNVNFGNQCGGSDPEDVIAINYEMLHTNMPFKIKFSSNLDGTSTTKSWGIRNLQIGVYKCHETCASCSGGAISDCISCYANAEKVNGICQCKRTFYAESFYPCITDICMVCQSCYLGCDICSNSGANDCSACISGYFLYTDPVTNKKQVRKNNY
jgi:hypothetical protein